MRRECTAVAEILGAVIGRLASGDRAMRHFARLPDPERVSVRYQGVDMRSRPRRKGRSDVWKIRKIDPFAPCEVAADVTRILERPVPLDPGRHGRVECSFEFGADERIDHPP